MIYLTAEQVLFIHYRLVSQGGGQHSVRDLPALQGALARPQARYDGQEVYTNIWWKCAVLFDGLLRNGPSTSNNQPIAIAAAGLFLHLNGYRLIMDTEEMVTFTRSCAGKRPPLSEIALWFERHARS
jgi:death-on-curing protein